MVCEHRYFSHLYLKEYSWLGGDVLSQLAIERKSFDNYDVKRTTRFFLYGAVITGPALKSWYYFLDRMVKGAPAAATLKRVALDQSIFAPIFCSTFLFNMSLWKTHSVDQAVQATKQNFVPIIVTNYKLWPAVQLVNFYFIPLQHRILVVNVVALFWNTFLAWRTEAYSNELPQT